MQRNVLLDLVTLKNTTHLLLVFEIAILVKRQERECRGFQPAVFLGSSK